MVLFNVVVPDTFNELFLVLYKAVVPHSYNELFIHAHHSFNYLLSLDKTALQVSLHL